MISINMDKLNINMDVNKDIIYNNITPLCMGGGGEFTPNDFEWQTSHHLCKFMFMYWE